MTNLVEKAEKTIREHRLLSDGDSVLVALSGGPDSVALLHALDLLKPRFDIRLAAAHLDHAIRRNSASDREFCRQLCRRLKVKFHSRRIDIRSMAKREKLSLEVAGRKARYAYLESLAKRCGYDRIATGHTLDDNVETVILNLARGSGLTGLAGIPSRRGLIMRPLLRATKRELVEWLRQRGIAFLKDPTNRSLRFARNRVRLSILPELQKLNPSARDNIARMAAILAEEVEFISRVAVSAYEKAELSGGKGKIVLDLEKLREYDSSLRKKVVLEAFKKLGGHVDNLSSKSLSRALDVIDGKSGAKSPLGNGVYVEQSQGRLSVFRDISRKRSTGLTVPGVTELAGIELYFESELIEMGSIGDLKAGPDVAYLDLRKLRNPRIRFWKNGDRIRPFGMRGHRLLSDVFIDRKIPEFERKQIPLVVSGDKVAWIAGVMISDEFKVDPGTRKVLKLQLCERS